MAIKNIIVGIVSIVMGILLLCMGVLMSIGSSIIVLWIADYVICATGLAWWGVMSLASVPALILFGVCALCAMELLIRGLEQWNHHE